MEYKNQYLLFPQFNATNTFMINYYAHNQTSDRWEIAFQYPGNKSGSIFGIAASSDLNYLSVVGTTITLNKGNISAGYSQINRYSHTAVRGEFTPNNKFFFTTNFDYSTSVYINCNWNTSGNYFYNSTSTACEQCPNCLDCGSGGVCVTCDEANNYFLDTGLCILCNLTGCTTCSSLTACSVCDEANNYFLDTGLCILCNLTNCATCSSLTTCSACESGYEISNSECVASSGGSTTPTTTTPEATILSAGQIAGIAVGSTAFVGLTSAASNYLLTQSGNSVSVLAIKIMLSTCSRWKMWLPTFDHDTFIIHYTILSSKIQQLRCIRSTASCWELRRA